MDKLHKAALKIAKQDPSVRKALIQELSQSKSAKKELSKKEFLERMNKGKGKEDKDEDKNEDKNEDKKAGSSKKAAMAERAIELLFGK